MSYIKIQKIKKETVDQPETGYIYFGYDDATVDGVGKGLWIKEDNTTPAYYIFDGYNPTAPIIYSLDPISGYAGVTSVLITGQNFETTSTVTFGGVACTSVTYIFSTQLRVIVPAAVSPGNVSVIVYNSGITSSNAMNFTVLNPVSNLPHINTLTPSSGMEGDQVLVDGYNFNASLGQTSIYFGNLAGAISFISPTQIYTSVPTGSPLGATPVHAEVLNVGSSNTVYFNVITDTKPVVTSFNPASGYPGDTIDVYGTNFSVGDPVSFGGYQASSVNFISSTHVQAVISMTTPPMPNTYIQVDGSNQLSGFEVLGTVSGNVPVITNITPLGKAAGETVLISGTNFPWNSVTFNGVPATPGSPATLGAQSWVIGPTTPAGINNVRAQNSYGWSIPPDYQYNVASDHPLSAPSIVSITPNSGITGDLITISGTNFELGTGVNAVYFGDTLASNIIGLSTSEIQCNIASYTETKILPVSVQTVNGKFALTGFTVGAISSPSVTSFSPNFGKPGDIISITGTSLAGVSVGFGQTYPGTLATLTTTGSTFITAIIPSGLTMAGDALPFNIYIYTISGSTDSIGSTGMTFEIYENPIYPASIQSFSPSGGTAGDLISISGINFTKYDTFISLQVYDSGTTSYAQISFDNVKFISNTTMLGYVPNSPYLFTGITSISVKNTANISWNSKTGFYYF